MTKPKRKYPLTKARLLDALERANLGTDNPGFCLACGYEQDGCEPDAQRPLRGLRRSSRSSEPKRSS
jgi:hypothetical protein